MSVTNEKKHQKAKLKQKASSNVWKNCQKEVVSSVSSICKIKLMSSADIKNIPVMSPCTVWLGIDMMVAYPLER